MKWRKVMKASHPRQVYRSAKANPVTASALVLALVSAGYTGFHATIGTTTIEFRPLTAQEKMGLAAQIETTKQVERAKRRDEFLESIRQTVRHTIEQEC
jgi:hypothetical protein